MAAIEAQTEEIKANNGVFPSAVNTHCYQGMLLMSGFGQQLQRKKLQIARQKLQPDWKKSLLAFAELDDSEI